MVGAGDAVKNGVERDDGDCWNAAIFSSFVKFMFSPPKTTNFLHRDTTCW